MSNYTLTPNNSCMLIIYLVGIYYLKHCSHFLNFFMRANGVKSIIYNAPKIFSFKKDVLENIVT